MTNQGELTYELIIGRFLAWAEAAGEVMAAFIVGSRARVDRPADGYSDLDLVLVVDDPSRFLTEDDWLCAIGSFHISFDEFTVGGGRERRVLFDVALDVDFLLYTSTQFLECARSPEFLSLFARGTRVLLDKGGFAGSISEGMGVIPPRETISREEFGNLANNFWYHAVWAAKKLARGELWVAKSCVDGYMKGLLLQMMECHARAKHGGDYETWHSGRFLESWAEPSVNEALPDTFGSYRGEDVGRALLGTMELFRRLSRESAAGLMFDNPVEAEQAAMRWVERILRAEM